MTESKSSKRKIEARGKEAMVIKLKMAGLSFDEIAAQLGYCNRGAAYKAFARAMENTIQEPADEYRTLTKDRLERLLQSSWGAALRGDLRAIDACRKIIKDLRDLFGLDAPIRIKDETPPDETLKAEIAALNARIDEMPATERRLLARALFETEDLFSDN